jgi:hypothetical protein
LQICKDSKKSTLTASCVYVYKLCYDNYHASCHYEKLCIYIVCVCVSYSFFKKNNQILSFLFLESFNPAIFQLACDQLACSIFTPSDVYLQGKHVLSG